MNDKIRLQVLADTLLPMKADELAYEIAVAENKIYDLYDTDRDAALAECQRLLGFAPRNLFAHFYAMLIYRNREDWELALSHAQTVKKLNACEPGIHGYLGDIFFKMGDTNRAIRHYKRESELYPDNWQARWDLAWIYLDRGRLKLALSHFEAVRKIDPRAQSLHLNIGVIFWQMGDVERAIRHYKRELELYPDCAEAHSNLGLIYFKRRRWKTAAKYLERCFALQHDKENLVASLAQAYENSGQVEKEIGLYHDYLQQFPDDGMVMMNLGGALLDMDDYDESLRYSRAAKELLPDDAIIDRNIQRAILYREGNDKEARAIPFE